MITQSRLKELLHYNLDTGEFTWIVPTSYRVRCGDVAGNVHHSGYRTISINKTVYKAQDLAFVYMVGRPPKNRAFHINGIYDDNSWTNLIECDLSEPGYSRIKYKAKTSAYRGVSWNNRANKWRATITVNSRHIHLGYFKVEIDAHKRYCEARPAIIESATQEK
jgi:hypothetical protein